ncbi:hypothetical protein DL93DRAFT_2151027 [Clavulina sp. PMI_390]|nr:hypothetical protein DL93DRAFT_2151027 [Clavulina sp. PMI_390]
MSEISLRPQDCAALSSRWEPLENGGIVASWAGQSIAFNFSGSSLSLKIGGATERREKTSGKTPMIAISFPPHSESPLIPADVKDMRTFDPTAGEVISLIQNKAGTETTIRLILIDWASTFELEAIVINSGATVTPFVTVATPVVLGSFQAARPHLPIHRVLFVGDSVSCGLVIADADAPPPMPLGCLQAFPFETPRRLASMDASKVFSTDLISYPAWHFVTPAPEEEKSGSIPPGGMESRFWKMGPVAKTSWVPGATERLEGIVLALGCNDDAIPAISPERFRDALISFVTKVKTTYEAEAKQQIQIPIYVIFCQAPWIEEGVPTAALYKDFETVILQGLKEQFGAQLVHFLPEVEVGAETVDGIHPTVAGHRLLAERLAKLMFDTNFC